MCDEPVKPTLTVSVEQKVVTQEYGGNAGVFMSMRVTEDTTTEEMEAVLNNGKIAYDKLRERIGERIKAIRVQRGVDY